MNRRMTSSLMLIGGSIAVALIMFAGMIFEFILHMNGCGSDFFAIFFTLMFVIETMVATYYIGRPDK